jgi:hypothetical protein
MTILLTEKASKFLIEQGMGWPSDENQARAIELAALQNDSDTASIRHARAESIASTHEHFVIVCLNCKGTNVYASNSLAWSICSGVRGSVDLVCDDCGTQVEIAEAEEKAE